MLKQLPLILAFLTISLVGTLEAQTRRGAVLNTFGNGDGDRFGATVSLSSDGTRVAVMAPDNGRFGTASPRAEVYTLQGGAWVKLGDTFTDYFTSPTNAEATIALSGNGTTVATGEPAYNIGTDTYDAGRIVTYRYGSGSWSTIGNELNGTYLNARLGEKIALIENGAQMMTASFGGITGDPRGAFNRILTSTGWQTVGTQPILQSNNEVAISGISLGRDGLRIAIGLDKGDTSPGEVQIYRYAGDWVSLGSLNGTSNGDGFGESLALGENGETAIVGAPNDGAGKVYVYDGTSQKGSTLEAFNDDQAFGYSVDISEDGSRIVIGAPGNDPSTSGAGKVYVYDFVGGDWSLQYAFSGTVAGEQAGQSVSLSNDGMHLAIGRPGFEAAGQSDAGQVDVYLLDGSSSTHETNTLDLQVYPNPTVGELRIRGLPQGESTIRILDAVGKLIATAAANGNMINVNGLSKGYYLLEVQGSEGIGRIPFVKK